MIKDLLLRGIRDLDNNYPRGSNTNTQAALRMMRTQFFGTVYDRSDAPNVGIIIMDGTPNIDVRNTIPEANLAKAANIKLIPVGVTNVRLIMEQRC